MSESSTHLYLVRSMSKWVLSKFANRGDGLIFTDLPECMHLGIPPLINGYRPDLYARLGKMVVLGEAKTSKDLDRRHSLDQFRSFLEYCSSKEDSAMVLAVPWQFSRLGRNILKSIQRETGAVNVNIYVIEKLSYTRIDSSNRNGNFFKN